MELVAENFKQTELGLIPIDWELKTLGEIAIIKDGTHQTPTYVDYGVPFYSVESVTNNNFSDTKFITEEAHKILTKSFRIERGDILMTRIGSIGDCKLIDWDVKASFYVSLALLKIKSEYLPNYISHYSKSASFQKETEINSLQSAIPRKINLGPISNIRVLIPTKAEQTAIATALSDSDALISSLEKLIAKKRNIKQGAMQKLLQPKEGWEVKKLGEVCENLGSGKSKTQSQEGSFPIFGSTGVIGWSTTFDYSGHKILVARVGANAGTVNVVDGKYCVSDNTLIVSLKPEIDLNFIYSFLILYQLNKLVFGSGQPLITGGQLKNVELKIPKNKEEQTLIATILCDMDAEISALETKLEKYKKVKFGMMQNLLTGKIRLI